MPKKTIKETEASTEAVAPEAQEKTKTAESKQSARTNEAIKKFQRNAKDTGSTEVQVAVLSEKIAQLSSHLSSHKKDNDSRMGLLKMISHRRSLLSYLEKKQPEQYKKLIASLGLRK